MTDALPGKLEPRTLRGRVAMWVAVSTTISLAIFAVIAYATVVIQEGREASPGLEDSASEARDEVLIAMGFAAPIGLALATAGAFLLTRRMLRPLDRVIHASVAITSERLEERLPLPAAPGELHDLVVAMNGLLARVEAGYASLSAFAADASHQLRTPLAVIGSEMEIALRRPRSVEEWQESARLTLEEVRRLSRLVDELLRQARSGAVLASLAPEPGDRG